MGPPPYWIHVLPGSWCVLDELAWPFWPLTAFAVAVCVCDAFLPGPATHWFGSSSVLCARRPTRHPIKALALIRPQPCAGACVQVCSVPLVFRVHSCFRSTSFQVCHVPLPGMLPSIQHRWHGQACAQIRVRIWGLGSTVFQMYPEAEVHEQ